MIFSTLNNDIKLEILVSTMNKTSLSFLESMFPYHKLENLNILIINQTDIGNKLVSSYNNIRIINSYIKGLSKSRNLAIENAIGDVCLIADDDVEYSSNFENIIVSAFEKLQEASIIRFRIDTFSGEVYKTYPKTSKRLFKKKEIENTSSIEIAFKRKDIIENKITFNTFFGLGSSFPSGEEYLFLKDTLRKGLQIYFQNTVIVKHKLESSTSNSNIASNDFIKTQAALYYHNYKELSYLYLFKFIIFLLRKQLISINDFIRKYNVGISAIKAYKKLRNAK